jgi:predicted AlkP superfamily pyrophosphatase or phosphodiesterase
MPALPDLHSRWHAAYETMMDKDNQSLRRRSLALILFIAALAFNLAPSFGKLKSPSAPPSPQSTTREPKRVLIISLDGLDVRYLQKRDEYGLKIPALRRLMKDGVMAEVEGVYPSVTYPSHTTIVTGATPRRHGIYGNELFEAPDQPESGNWYWYARDIRAETLWDAASKAGLKTAMISWPVSVGAGDYNFPEIWKPKGTRIETGAVIKANALPGDLVKELEGRDPQLYSNVKTGESDDMRTRFAEFIIAEKKPEVVLVHLFDLDHFEHTYGPFTPEAFAMLEKVDAYVARLLAAVERAGTGAETAVFIVSDHGFLPVSKRIHPGVILARAGLLTLREEKDERGVARAVVTNWRAAPYISGGSCAIILRDKRDRDAYDKALAAFREFAAGEGRAALRVIEEKEAGKLETNSEAALILEASDGYYFNSGYSGAAITTAGLKGQHGFLPSRSYTSFIASGAGVGKRGTLGTLRLIDEGPTMARLLGLKLKHAQGRALSLK